MRFYNENEKWMNKYKLKSLNIKTVFSNMRLGEIIPNKKKEKKILNMKHDND